MKKIKRKKDARNIKSNHAEIISQEIQHFTKGDRLYIGFLVVVMVLCLLVALFYRQLGI